MPILIFSLFQITENSDSELEFFETSARTGQGVTEVRRILSVLKSLQLVTNTAL